MISILLRDLDPATLVAWYAFLCLIIVWLQRETRCFTRLSVWSVFVLLLLMHCGLSAPIDRNVTYHIDGMRMPDYVARRWWTGLILMFSALPASAWLVNTTLAQSWGRIRDRLRVPPDGENRLPTAVLVGAFLCVIASVLTFSQTQFGFSLLDLLTGRLTATQYALGRASVGLSQDISGSPLRHAVRVVFWGLLPTVLCVLLAYGRKRRPILLVAIALAAAFGIQGMLSGQKQPLLFLFITLWLGWRMAGGKRNLPINRVPTWLVCAFVIAVVLPFVYSLQYPFLDYSTRLFSSLFRLTSETNRTLLYYFALYPDRFGFLHGGSSGLIGGFLGIAPAAGLPERAIPVYMLGPDYLNSWNTVFIGYAWTDFGMVGVLLASLGLGGLLQVVHLWFEGGELGPLHTGVLTGLAMAASRFAESSITATLLTFGFGISLLLYALPGLGWAVPRTIGFTRNA